MIEIFILALFFGGIVAGSIIAVGRRRLPTAKQLETEDRIRFARYKRSL